MSRSGPGKRRAPLVRDGQGVAHPFLRGIVTHDLMQRGMSFDDAYAAARALRDRLSDRDEVSAAELEDLIERQIEELFGSERLATLRGASPPELSVIYPDQRPVPFSRGLLAQSLLAVGLDLDRAYRLVVEAQRELQAAGVRSLDNRELARWVGDLLERWEGADVAGRYRVLRRIRRLPRPLVIYIGGASGTGKSTLSLELAPLLRIYRINATDTIRQVMRMVFSSAILPSLHRSSFETAPAERLSSAAVHEERRPRVVASFEEQAVRVCVGVRAVVERSIAENVSILVEGVHLAPGLVPFAGLAGAAEQVTMILSTLDEEVHRGHLHVRGLLGRRQDERYLAHFSAIRALQEHLLQLAEEHDVAVLDTSDGELMVPRAVRILAEDLTRRLPWLAAGVEAGFPVPALLLLVDGLGDGPVRALGGRTPLQAASTPTLDRLAREGCCGLADPVAPGVVPDTASGNLAAFGQAPRAMTRGPIEALGASLELRPDDVALRANLVTLDDEGRIEDRRAGRVREETAELAAALDGIELPRDEVGEVTVRVGAGTEHRLAVVLRGEGLSSSIVGSDPGEAAPPGPPLVPRPVDPEDEAAERTAKILARFEGEARRVLAAHPANRRRVERGLEPANAVITRGAGRIHRLQPLEPGGVPLRFACIGGDRTVLGLASPERR
jgi:2-phosphoglycerate kinase